MRRMVDADVVPECAGRLVKKVVYRALPEYAERGDALDALRSAAELDAGKGLDRRYGSRRLKRRMLRAKVVDRYVAFSGLQGRLCNESVPVRRIDGDGGIRVGSRRRCGR